MYFVNFSPFKFCKIFEVHISKSPFPMSKCNSCAHELHFDIGNGDFEIWTSNILQNLKGEKFTKYTYRTKIVHSFSVLSKNILEIEKRE